MSKLFKKVRRACLFAAAGAAGAYLLDPERGAVRRAKTMEKFQSVKGQAGSQASKVAQQSQTAAQQAQVVTAQAASQAHDLKAKVTGDTSADASSSADDAAGGSSDGAGESDDDGPSTRTGAGVRAESSRSVGHDPDPFDSTDRSLADAVRQYLTAAGISTSDIAVDAADGVVALRGRVETSELESRIVEETGTVDGVKEVRSFLHQAGGSVASAEAATPRT